MNTDSQVSPASLRFILAGTLWPLPEIPRASEPHLPSPAPLSPLESSIWLRVLLVLLLSWFSWFPSALSAPLSSVPRSHCPTQGSIHSTVLFQSGPFQMPQTVLSLFFTINLLPSLALEHRALIFSFTNHNCSLSSGKLIRVKSIKRTTGDKRYGESTGELPCFRSDKGDCLSSDSSYELMNFCHCAGISVNQISLLNTQLWFCFVYICNNVSLDHKVLNIQKRKTEKG